MFEQSSYEPTSATEPSTTPREDELFRDYELRTWDLSPRIYWILGASAVGNILALLIVAQTSLLTMKGCDSPLVGSVCQALDTVYISTMLFGTPREVADAEYEKTELENADITYLDYTGVQPPLSYPEGYFQLANPEQFVATQPTPDPLSWQPFAGTTMTMSRPNSGNRLIDTKPHYPRAPKGSVVNGKLPIGVNDPAVADANTTSEKGRQGKPRSGDPTASASPNPSATPVDPANTADKKDEAAPDQYGIYINKRPTDDFALQALQRLENKQVSLDAPFKVTIKGTLGLAKDGKTVVLKNPKPVIGPNEVAGDPEMLKFAQETIIAFADAGWFGYLDKLSTKNVVVHLEQNDTTVIARLTADQPDENRAKTAASGLNAILALGAATSEGDNKTFLGAATTGNDGKTFFVNFELPRQAFTEMVQRKLAEVKNKPKQSNQNSNTSGKAADNFARN